MGSPAGLTNQITGLAEIFYSIRFKLIVHYQQKYQPIDNNNISARSISEITLIQYTPEVNQMIGA